MNTIASFIEAATPVVTAEFPSAVLSAEPGKRFTRIVVTKYGDQRSVFCFVENATGDIYKAASWKIPAKHVRGNIANGANDVGAYGPAYLPVGRKPKAKEDIVPVAVETLVEVPVADVVVEPVVAYADAGMEAYEAATQGS